MRLQVTLAAVLAWPGVTLAADVAVYSGDPAGVAERLAAATKRPASEFQVVSLHDYVKGRAPTLTAGKIETCTSVPTDGTGVAALLAKAEGLAGEMEFSAAQAALAEAMGAVRCLDARVDPAQVARIAFLQGVMSHFAGDADASKAAFQLAWSFDPGMQWDSNFPPSARSNFDSTKDEVTKAVPVALAVVPHGTVVLDGRTVEAPDGRVDVGQGPHLIQVGAGPMSTMLVVATAPASLVVPAALPDNAVSWAADPVRGADLARLLDVVDPAATFYAVTGDAVWQNTGSATTWTALGADTTQKKPPIGLALVGAGGAVFVGGAVITSVGLSSGNAAVADASATGVRYEDWQAAQERYDSARTLSTVGKVIAITGLVAVGSGVSMLGTEVRVGPMWLSRGGGLSLTVTEAR